MLPYEMSKNSLLELGRKRAGVARRSSVSIERASGGILADCSSETSTDSSKSDKGEAR
jgi:hypothetical protein